MLKLLFKGFYWVLKEFNKTNKFYKSIISKSFQSAIFNNFKKLNEDHIY